MTRVKRGVTALKRRRNILKRVKGFRFGRGTKEIEAKTALLHAGTHAFAHRRDKKSDRRRLWQVKINAALRPLGYSYSKFIDILTKKSIGVDRKILADLAENNPSSFERVVKSLS
ncbi:MAG: 50S ribosomal protein L20 [Candidatus Pacebacteria bacterium]|jgi:large subunit ribosomal protein L20|nr:50S ribosomal protein L20 [Candidatus Paceibacterota bacterium]MBP9780657.1 50S ribosomal protein L20 [Candidatus Paceibacterota bacterium]MDQ5949908.1 large subunit ribosomal protein [Patescibacteria group bacterium]MDQ5961634.1 large subunit ribosomal protein [Patescibacteria group bacterium]